VSSSKITCRLRRAGITSTISLADLEFNEIAGKRYKPSSVSESATRDLYIEESLDHSPRGGATVARKIGALPLVENGKLTGLITITDRARRIDC
jgi:hypothetical protein